MTNCCFFKTFSDENMIKLVSTLRDEKLSIENEAKVTVQKMIKEKNEISQKYDELKVSPRVTCILRYF